MFAFLPLCTENTVSSGSVGAFAETGMYDVKQQCLYRFFVYCRTAVKNIACLSPCLQPFQDFCCGRGFAI